MIVLRRQHGVIGFELYAMTSMATFALYGQGCPGTGNLVPQLNGAGTPLLGGTFSVTCSDGLANSAAVLELGFAPLNLPLGNNCTALFDLTQPFVSFGGATNARGDVSYGLPVPSDRNLEGLQLFAQCLVVDPRGAFLSALSFSNGLRAVVQQS